MSLLLPALLWFLSQGSFVFGGARPVPVTPRKYRNFVRGDLIVSSAGVITNFLLAFACAAVFVGFGGLASFVPVASDGLAILQRMMLLGIRLNLILAVFNLIPIPPLDGSHLLYHALPATAGARYRSIGQYGFIPLFVLLMFLPGVINLLLTPASWGFAQFYHVVSPFGIGELWDFTRG
jgi:Zn-dependent protease